jgi:lipid-binding SYLF domain-containing protein
LVPHKVLSDLGKHRRTERRFEMSLRNFGQITSFIVVGLLAFSALPSTTRADTAAEIDRDVTAALNDLYRAEPGAEALGPKAKAILVFPDVIKAGLIIGGQYGEGAMRRGGKTTGYYSTVAASYGLQAGAQSFGYAMFLMTDSTVEYVEESDGWEIGTGPSIVVIDKGAAGALTSTTLKDDIYVFFFDQEGLMAGLGIQGTKISKIQPDE